MTRAEYRSLNRRQRAFVNHASCMGVRDAAIHAPLAILVVLCLLGGLDTDPFKVIAAIWPFIIFPPVVAYVVASLLARRFERILLNVR